MSFQRTYSAGLLLFVSLFFSTSCQPPDPNISFENTSIPRFCENSSIADYQVYFNKSEQEEWRNFECGCNNEASIRFWFEHREIFHEAQKCLNMTESCFGDEAIGSYYSEIIARSGRVDRSNPNNPIRVDCDQDGVSFCQASLSFTIQIPTLNLESLQQKINHCLQEDYNLQNFEYQQDLLLAPERLCLGEDIDCVDLVGLDDENEVARVENDDHWPQLSRCTQIAIRTSYAEAVRSLYESNGFEGASLNNYDPDDDKKCSLLDTCPFHFDEGEDLDEDNIVDACDPCIRVNGDECLEFENDPCQLCSSNPENRGVLGSHCLFNISPPENIPELVRTRLFHPMEIQNDYMTIGDFNNDRKKDFVLFISGFQKAYFFSDFFSKFLPGRSLTFNNADVIIDLSEIVDGNGIPNSVSYGDFNGDNIDDLILGNIHYDNTGALIIIAGGIKDENNNDIYFKKKENIEQNPFEISILPEMISNIDALIENHIYIFAGLDEGINDNIPEGFFIGENPITTLGPLHMGDIPYIAIRGNLFDNVEIRPQHIFKERQSLVYFNENLSYLDNLGIPRTFITRSDLIGREGQFGSISSGYLIGEDKKRDFVFAGINQEIVILNNDRPFRPYYNLTPDNINLVNNAMSVNVPSLEGEGWTTGISDINSDGYQEFYVITPDWEAVNRKGRIILSSVNNIHIHNPEQDPDEPLPPGPRWTLDEFLENSNSKQIQATREQTWLGNRGIAIFSSFTNQNNNDNNTHYFAPANLSLQAREHGSIFGFCNGLEDSNPDDELFIQDGNSPDVIIQEPGISWGWNLQSYSSGNNRRCLFFTDLQGRIWGRCESDPYQNNQ